jgi:hypothetical protein
VTLDPETRLQELLNAIPSSSKVLRRFGIEPDGNEEKKLGWICQYQGVPFEDFLQAMDELDWDEEIGK